MLAEGLGTWFHQSQIHIDTQELYNGHPTLRYDWPANTGCEGTPKGDYAIVADYRPPSAREVWIEVAHKFDPTFDDRGHDPVTGVRCSTSAYKFLLMWRPNADRYDIVNSVDGKWWSGEGEDPPYSGTAYCDAHGCYYSPIRQHLALGLNQARYLPGVPGKNWDGPHFLGSNTARSRARPRRIRGGGEGVAWRASLPRWTAADYGLLARATSRARRLRDSFDPQPGDKQDNI
jgi:hypothetical protein